MNEVEMVKPDQEAVEANEATTLICKCGHETLVRCGRCETPICPKCMIGTPVGMRCARCANVRPSPIYDVRGRPLLRAIGVAVGVVLVGGFLFGIVGPFISRSLLIGVFAYLLVGVGIAELLSLAANRKRGPRLQLLSIATVALTAFALPLLGLLLTGHFGVSGLSVLLVIVACAAAYQRLR